MRVLVISDTHIPIVNKRLPKRIEEEARASDCCIHAGDFISYKVFEDLSRLTKEVYGVSGNMDSEDVTERLPQKRIIELEKVKIGLTHGRGTPAHLIDYVDMAFSKEREEIDSPT